MAYVRRPGQRASQTLSSTATPETIERVRRAGFRDFVAKFDRQGLIAAIKEQAGAVTSRAA